MQCIAADLEDALACEEHREDLVRQHQPDAQVRGGVDAGRVESEADGRCDDEEDDGLVEVLASDDAVAEAASGAGRGEEAQRLVSGVAAAFGRRLGRRLDLLFVGLGFFGAARAVLVVTVGESLEQHGDEDVQQQEEAHH